MRVLVYGAGAIGSVLGAFLARAGHDVTLVGRRRHLDAIARSGLLVTGIWGDFRVKAFDLHETAAEASARRTAYDWILLTVKSYDTSEASSQIRPLVGERTQVAAFQNGLGNAEAALEILPPEHYLAGRAIFGAEAEPGLVRVTVEADPLAIGPLRGHRTVRTALELAQLFQGGKLAATAVDDILPVLWSKAVYNCALNGPCSLAELPYGSMLETEDSRRLLAEIVRECYAVAPEAGVTLDPPDPESYLRVLTDRLIPKTAAHYPSMLRDLRAGRRTEIEALNGAIGRLGRRAGIPTPANDRIAEAVLSKSSAPLPGESS